MSANGAERAGVERMAVRLTPAVQGDVADLINSMVGSAARPRQAIHSFAYTIGRELAPEDWELSQAAGSAGAPGSRPAPLSTVRARHHMAARLFAAGLSVHDVSLQTGYTTSRLYVLKGDPTFRDLIAHYQACEHERFEDVQERMKLLGLAAADEILDRLETAPETISTETLRSLVATMLDRAGHGPVQKQQSITVHMSRDELMQLKGAVDARTAATTEISKRAARSADPSGAAVEHTEAEAAAGSEGGGSGVREGAGALVGEVLPAGSTPR